MELFDEILTYHRSTLSLEEKYSRLYNLLDRVCKELTARFDSDFSNLFSRLYALCTHTGMRRGAIEQFRIHARRILHHEEIPDEENYLYDLKALCEAISHFYRQPIPATLTGILPREWRSLPSAPHNHPIAKRIRIVVERWDDAYIYGYSDAFPDEQLLCIDYHSCPYFAEIGELLFQGAQLNLLTVHRDDEQRLCPEIIVLEPDYLLDISSLAECLQSYGDHPYNYLIQKFKPREQTHHILLGHTANQFLDDCVNEQPDHPATYEQSIRQVFRNNLLAYSACGQIDKEYFERAQTQFRHIRQTVQAVFQSPTCQIDKSGALLEPSFLCECLGLQGRMDFLQGDYRNLIELKSGKAEGFGPSIRPRDSHALQMALYKEVLYYNQDIPRDNVSSYLFYSQYPKLFAERSAKAQIQRAIQLRNRIIACERSLLTDGGRPIFSTLTPETLNIRQSANKLWTHYQRPQLQQFLAPFQTSDELALSYFYTFTAFVQREQFMAKLGDSRPDSNNGFAATWNSDTTSKLSSGNILTDLAIRDFTINEGIEQVHLSIPSYSEGFLPNFRQGDIILLYERNGEKDNATNQQVIRGSIGHIAPDSLSIVLKNKQRNPQIFHRQSLYAIEHDYMDSSFSNLYRGLYALLNAPEHRRSLLLAQRAPETAPSITLTGQYPNAQIEDLVLRAKQATDYFLLVGPPGTGKTSVALRSMVEEFHATPTCNILLLSYTNRAVDEICDMLESIQTPPDYLRIGNELSCEKRFHPHLLKNAMQEHTRRTEVCHHLAATRIIAGTVSSISGCPELFALKHFDVAIVDEASQILEPQILGILCATHQGQCAIDKFILVGDHKQLPAVVMQSSEVSAVSDPALHAIGLTDCRNSLFERLHSLPASERVRATLHRQGRMHPDISHFASDSFYEGILDIVPTPHQQAPLEWIRFDATAPFQRLLSQNRLCFMDTPYPPAEDSNKINRTEAHTIARLTEAIYHLCQANNLPFDAAHRIGIIVPFRNQIAMIAHELAALHIPGTEEITIDTVERYQGSQRDIILYSTTISQPYQLDILSVPSHAGGITVDRKLNVAITRARKQLFIVGNASLLSRNDIYRRFINHIRQHGIFVQK